MTMTQASYPIAPAVEQRKGTLLDTASVDPDGFRWMDGNDLFPSYNSMKFESSATICAPSTKTFANSPVWVDGIRIFAYGGVVCKAVGLDQPEMLREVERVFKAGESTAVERGLMAQRFIADPPGNGSRWAAPVDITPAGGAVKPGVGIALLEGYASNNYVGAPTLHIPVVIASLILGVDGAEFAGDVLQSKMGSKLVAGVGYDYPNLGPTGAAAAIGEKWLYATGSVYVAPGPVDVRQAMAMDTNEVFVLGERGYIVATDGPVAAVRVTVTG